MFSYIYLIKAKFFNFKVLNNPGSYEVFTF